MEGPEDCGFCPALGQSLQVLSRRGHTLTGVLTRLPVWRIRWGKETRQEAAVTQTQAAVRL